MNPEDLSGLIDDDQGNVLRYLASQVPARHAVVEIGSFRGKSTSFLADGSRLGNGAPVYAVDPWDLPGNPYGKHGFSAPEVRESFESQLRSCRLWSRVNPVQAFSTVAASNYQGPEIGLLYIDGDHEEHAVRNDIRAWSPHLADEHTLVFDDLDTARNPGVRVVVDELADRYIVEKVAVRFGVLTPR